MYHMKPFHQFDASDNITDCMYKMKKICSSQGDVEADVPQAAQDLLNRQNQLIARLEALQMKVESMTVAASSKQAVKPVVVSSRHTAKTNFPKDLVIACNPEHKPTVLLDLLLSLKRKHNILLVEYMHNSARTTKPMNLSQHEFVSGLRGISRAANTMVVTWIWKKCDDQCEMMVSPIIQTKIQGEINICRYLMRVSGDQVDTPVNYWLDTATSILRGHDLKKSAGCLAEYLSKNKYLHGNAPSTTDLIVKSALEKAATTSRDLANNASIQRWMHS